MERETVKSLFGNNFIGVEELSPFFLKMGLDPSLISEVELNFSDYVLEEASKNGYILILGVEKLGDIVITPKFLRDTFGFDPEVSEPCLYNQDWYMKEDFMNRSLGNQWYLIKKDVFENSRAVMPVDLQNRGLQFPSAILCLYTFFAYYFAYNVYLWYHDFVWCSDTDHNGDRVYVGKYHDVDGVNKNGFSIHRHLALRPCYASSDCLM